MIVICMFFFVFALAFDPVDVKYAPLAAAADCPYSSIRTSTGFRVHHGVIYKLRIPCCLDRRTDNGRNTVYINITQFIPWEIS